MTLREHLRCSYFQKQPRLGRGPLVLVLLQGQRDHRLDLFGGGGPCDTPESPKSDTMPPHCSGRAGEPDPDLEAKCFQDLSRRFGFALQEFAACEQVREALMKARCVSRTSGSHSVPCFINLLPAPVSVAGAFEAATTGPKWAFPPQLQFEDN